jgi:hypothetical protein
MAVPTWQTSPTRLQTPFANFLPVHDDLRGRGNSKANLITLDRYHRDLNVAADNDFLSDPSREHEHIDTLLEKRKSLSDATSALKRLPKPILSARHEQICGYEINCPLQLSQVFFPFFLIFLSSKPTMTVQQISLNSSAVFSDER